MQMHGWGMVKTKVFSRLVFQADDMKMAEGEFVVLLDANSTPVAFVDHKQGTLIPFNAIAVAEVEMELP